MAQQENFLSKNLFSIIPLIASVVTAFGSSYALQSRLDERVSRATQDVQELKEELKNKVTQQEFNEMKNTLSEMKGDIKELLKHRR